VHIIVYQLLLISSPRSDPRYRTSLKWLAGLWFSHHKWSDEKGDLDRSITHLTEAILLPSQDGQDVIPLFFRLAIFLFLRFLAYGQPEDVKLSLKFFLFLRNNFHPRALNTFDITHYELTSRLVQALAHKLMAGFGDLTSDMEEMAALTHRLLASGTSSGSRDKLSDAIRVFSTAAFKESTRGDTTQQIPDRVIQVLREAALIMPDNDNIHLALARCLATRFDTTHAINDYEEAMDFAHKIIDLRGPGDGLTPTAAQMIAMEVVSTLVFTLISQYTNPVYLEDSIHRIRHLLRVFSLPHTEGFTPLLGLLEQKRLNYFGITGSSVETPFELSEYTRAVLSDPSLCFQVHIWDLPVKSEDHSSLEVVKAATELQRLHTSICSNETTDVEEAVGRGRAILPSPDYRFSHLATHFFADLLYNMSVPKDGSTLKKQLPRTVIFGKLHA
jgi:hypothetical protein